MSQANVRHGPCQGTEGGHRPPTATRDSERWAVPTLHFALPRKHCPGPISYGLAFRTIARYPIGSCGEPFAERDQSVQTARRIENLYRAGFPKHLRKLLLCTRTLR